MDGQTVVGIVVGALFLAGLVGALIPWIPGPLFILIGVLVWAVATQFAVIGVGRLVILITLALTTLLVNFVAGTLRAPRGGRGRPGRPRAPRRARRRRLFRAVPILPRVPGGRPCRGS